MDRVISGLRRLLGGCRWMQVDADDGYRDYLYMMADARANRNDTGE
jgi:hypothetical protein